MSAILALLVVGLVIAILLVAPSAGRGRQGVPLYDPGEHGTANESNQG